MTGTMRKIGIMASAVICAFALTLGFATSAFAAQTKVQVTTSNLDGSNEQVESVSISNSGDARKSLQELFDRAKSGQVKTTITMPEANYNISGKLIIYSNTTLDMTAGTTITRTGDGLNDGILYNYPDNWVEGGSTDRNNVGAYDMSRNITVLGGTLDGGNTAKAKTPTDLLRIDHAQNILIDGVALKNVYNCHMVELVADKDVVVSNCTFEGFKGNTPDNCEAVQVEGAWTNNPSNLNDIDSLWAKGSKVDGYACENVTISGCKFYNLPSACGQHHATKDGKARSNNVKILNNIIIGDSSQSYYKTAVTVSGMNNVTISGNNISGAYRMMVHASRANGVVIEGNTVSGCTENSIMIDDLAKSVVCNGNKVTSSKKHAISVADKGTTVTSISSNTAKKTTGSDGSGICVSGGTVKLISNNVIDNVKKNGIIISGGTVGVKNKADKGIVGNTITNVKNMNGITIAGKSTTVYNVAKNTIDNVKKSGISVTEGTVGTLNKTDVGIVGNKITKCLGANGITLSGSKVKVYNVSSNNISKITKGNGVSITYKAKVYVVAKNTIKVVKTYKGVWVGGSPTVKTKVTKNKITAALEKRAIVAGSGGKFKASDNTITVK